MKIPGKWLVICVLAHLTSPAAAQAIYGVDRFGYLWAQLAPEAWTEFAHQKLAQDAWIDKRRMKSGELCCYRGQDCNPIPVEDVLSHRDGVQLSQKYGGFVVPGHEIQHSEDHRYWMCWTPKRMRCFFAPFSGS